MEELTWRLQLEKRLRVIHFTVNVFCTLKCRCAVVKNHISICWVQTEMEETKAQEITKLQEALRASKLQMEEAKSKAIQEQEAVRKAFEEALPVIKETPVIVQDTEKIDALNAEVESLKVGTLK